MDIDKRLEGLTMNVELLTRDIHDLQGIVRELASYIKDIAVGRPAYQIACAVTTNA